MCAEMAALVIFVTAVPDTTSKWTKNDRETVGLPLKFCVCHNYESGRISFDC